VAVFLVGRQGVKGGETRVIHESTPIQPLQADRQAGYRDTLVVTLRRGGFPGEGHTRFA